MIEQESMRVQIPPVSTEHGKPGAVAGTVGASHIRYNCDVCTAQCTFEAMQWCPMPREFCPVLRKLESGEIVDRRQTDGDPTFPSEFTYA